MPNNLGSDPFATFDKWYKDAEADPHTMDHTAFTLATCSPGGIPSARVVLLKEHGRDGFVFFTNKQSVKGEEINLNPRIAMCFYWEGLGRQIRICGTATHLEDGASDAYFASRPIESRVGAVISAQSQTLDDYETFVSKWKSGVAKVTQGEAPPPERPACWGGFRICPVSFEFWQAREFRVHLRVRYLLLNDGKTDKGSSPEGEATWEKSLLYP